MFDEGDGYFVGCLEWIWGLVDFLFVYCSDVYGA